MLVLLLGVWQLVVAGSFSGKVTMMPLKGKVSQFIERGSVLFKGAPIKGLLADILWFSMASPVGNLQGEAQRGAGAVLVPTHRTRAVCCGAQLHTPDSSPQLFKLFWNCPPAFALLVMCNLSIIITFSTFKASRFLK